MMASVIVWATRELRAFAAVFCKQVL
jgi:hypothetical protein